MDGWKMDGWRSGYIMMTNGWMKKCTEGDSGYLMMIDGWMDGWKSAREWDRIHYVDDGWMKKRKAGRTVDKWRKGRRKWAT
jgi:hypothetical protein